MTRKIHTPKNAGQTIVEIVIAIGVVGLVMTTVVGAITVSLRNTSRAKAKALATKYTQEGIEYFRTQRNLLGWESFLEVLQQRKGANFCMATLPYDMDNSYQLRGQPGNENVDDQGKHVGQYKDSNSGLGGLSDLPNRACLPNEYVDAANIYQRRGTVVTSVSGGQDVVTVTITVTWIDGARTQTSTATVELRKNQN
jgi:type II secretory pathway pseudopilin PulG